MMRNVSPDFADLLEECMSLTPHKEELISAIINTLAKKGWSIVPPNHIPLPTNVALAEAMLLVAESYLKGHQDATSKETSSTNSSD